MEKLAFGYIRRSSYKQLENNSIEIQKQHIQEFAKRNQMYVPEEFIFIEDVTSAFTKRANQRKVLMQMGEKMVEMDIPIVIFYDESRMDRTGYSFTIDFYRPLLNKLPSLNVYSTMSNEPIDPDSMDMKLNFLLYQHESEVKSVRAIGSLISNLEQNTTQRPGSKIPFGYIQKDKKLYPSEDAEIVSFIFFLYSWGHSLNKIALLLNEANIPSPRGKQWRSSTVENILKNPVYTGDLIWEVQKRQEGQKQFLFKNTHEAIIDDFLIQSHQHNKLLQENYGRLDTPFLFLNKIKCKHCGQILATKNASTKRNEKNYHYYYYFCKSCDYKVDAENVHQELMPLILNRVQSFVLLEEPKQQNLILLTQMQQNVEELILEKEELLNSVSQKMIKAKELNDRELELFICSLINQYQDELITLQYCQKSLEVVYYSVASNDFYNRFQSLFTHRLDLAEQRLIILYFVDFVSLSDEFKTKIYFKENIFEDYLTF